LLNFELNPLIFLERAIAAPLDRRVMDEKILRTIVRSDEAEALLTVEPLHSSLCHLLTSLIQFRMYQKHPRDHDSTNRQFIEIRCGAALISVVYDRSGDHVHGRRSPGDGAAAEAAEQPSSMPEHGGAP
jgi:hypothetical protein